MTDFTKEFRATAVCPVCDWTAVHQDDDPVALAAFLRARLIEHTETHTAIEKAGPHKTDDEAIVAARIARGDHLGCPGCGRIMSDREAREQSVCDDCRKGDAWERDR